MREIYNKFHGDFTEEIQIQSYNIIEYRSCKYTSIDRRAKQGRGGGLGGSQPPPPPDFENNFLAGVGSP